MDLQEQLERIAPLVVHESVLTRRSRSWRALSAATGEAPYARLRRGWYLPADTWTAANAEGRHLAAIVAAVKSEVTPRIFSHRSAATLLGLPVWSRWMLPRSAHDAEPRGSPMLGTRSAYEELPVHFTVPKHAHGNQSPYTIRHRNALGGNDVVQIAGLMLTSGERTVFDLARSEPFPIALVCADAFLRTNVRTGRHTDLATWRAWRTRMIGRANAMPRARGMAAVRAIAALADPRADSPLESASRLRALQIGLTPELQVVVPSERGGTYYLDMLFREIGVFGECDGKAKYTDPAQRNGRSADEVVYSEKRRHDWIAGTQGWRGVRWGAAEATTPAALAGHLRAQRIEVPGRPSQAFGAGIARFLGSLNG